MVAKLVINLPTTEQIKHAIAISFMSEMMLYVAAMLPTDNNVSPITLNSFGVGSQ